MADAARASSMQLLAQDLADVVTALRAAQDTAGHERRRSTRLDVQAQVRVIPFADGLLGKPFTCMTRDVSFKGLGLLQSKQAARGSQFVITLPRRVDVDALHGDVLPRTGRWDLQRRRVVQPHV
jgi:hypothetical protein